MGKNMLVTQNQSLQNSPFLMRTISIVFVILFLFSSQAMAEESSVAKFQLDVDYSLVEKQQTSNFDQLSELEGISNVELFYWIGCQSCYQVELALAVYLEQNTETSFRRTPLIIRSEWRAQAYLQSIILQLSQNSYLENLPTSIDFYKQCITDCQPFKSFETAMKWISDQMKGQELPSLDKEQIWQSEKNFQKRADLFSITQVPTIIINERYKITAKQAKTPARMVEIANYLIAN